MVQARAQPVCPLGYGSGSARSTPMECGLCRAVLFEAVRMEPCECSYCHDCGARIKRDCLKCARDVESMRLDPEMDEKVEVFIQAHKAQDGKKNLGLFYLETALKHRASENKFAADARLSMAVAAFHDAAAWEEKAVSLSTQASLRQALFQDAETARQLYETALQILEDKCPEVHQTLAVAKTRFAIFEHTTGNSDKAVELYQGALDARQAAFKAGDCRLVDVASSKFGLASVLSDLGRHELARPLYEDVHSSLGDTTLDDRFREIYEATKTRLTEFD